MSKSVRNHHVEKLEYIVQGKLFWCASIGVFQTKASFRLGMGRKSGGNAYKNPVDSYRKQLGKNEENKTSMGPRCRGSRHKPTSQREIARSRKAPKNWWSLAVWSVGLLLIVGGVFALVTFEAGKYMLGRLFHGST